MARHIIIHHRLLNCHHHQHYPNLHVLIHLTPSFLLPLPSYHNIAHLLLLVILNYHHSHRTHSLPVTDFIWTSTKKTVTMMMKLKVKMTNMMYSLDNFSKDSHNNGWSVGCVVKVFLVFPAIIDMCHGRIITHGPSLAQIVDCSSVKREVSIVTLLPYTSRRGHLAVTFVERASDARTT